MHCLILRCGHALPIRWLVPLSVTALLLGCSLATIAAPPNKAPTVAITAPANGATFTAGASIPITATAADSDGSVAKVDFYRGGTIVLGSRTASPYTILWSNVPAGSYSLTAIATDNLGAAKTSTAVAITVNPAPNVPPAVSIVSPGNGATYYAPASLTLTANASDSDGSVSRVDFFQGATQLNPSATAPPYAITLSNLGVGNYAFTARATDNAGATTTSAAVSIVVGPPNLPPQVVLTAPLPCSVYDAPASIVLTADAVDPDGDVGKVDFLIGGNLLGTVSAPPYSFTWTNVLAGTYAIAARATDKQGATATSTPVTITVRARNQPPLITLTAPTNGATFYPGAPIAMTATASDSDGTVRQVDFFDGATVIATASTAPYSATWSTSIAGSHTLTARATDNANAVTTSSPVTINILANQPPTVSLTAPVAGSRYVPPVTVNLTAEASDSDGSVSKVEFFADGIAIGAPTAAPYTVAWSTAIAGSHMLTAAATDNRGATTTTAPLSITVDAPPVITLTAPADGAVYPAPGNFTITAHATDNDGTLTRVELFHDGISMSAVTPAAGTANFTLNYLWNPVPAGSYVLTAQATDNDGARTTSAPVRVVVHTAPAVTLTAPVAGSTYLAPANVTLTAAPVVAGATVTKVDFYAGTTPLGTANGPPFSVSWSNVPAASYSLTAVVTDSLGATAISPPVSITVTNNSPPMVSLTAPASGANYFAPATVNLAATASDSNGSIVQVDFYQGSTLLGTRTAPPYALAWTSVPPGNYVLTAVAQDNQGARTTSAAVTIAVMDTGFAITSPADGSTISNSMVNIAGSVQAPANSGVTVNGIVAALDGAGHFYANGVALAAGANTVTAILTQPDGQTTNQSITLNSSGPGPILISASPMQGLSPLTIVFTATAQPGTTIQKMELDWNGDGVFDFAKTAPDWSITSVSTLATSAGTSVINMTVRVTDIQANITTQTFPIVLRTAAALDQQLRALWSGMTTALAAGNMTTALQYLNSQARIKYGPVFDALLPQLPAIVDALSVPRTMTITNKIGEYAVNQVIDGVDSLYFIHVLLDADGVWRIDSM